jgi:hypothetical protein
MEAFLVIVDDISCDQAALPMPLEDYKWLLAIQDRLYPINFFMNIAKVPNPQVICLDASLSLPYGNIIYQRQLS